jgi:hypothetical protein
MENLGIDRWRIILKRNLREMEFEGVDRDGLA